MLSGNRSRLITYATVESKNKRINKETYSIATHDGFRNTRYFVRSKSIIALIHSLKRDYLNLNSMDFDIIFRSRSNEIKFWNPRYCNRTLEIMDEWGESIERPKLLRHVNNRVVGIMLFDLVQEVHGT